MSKAEDIKLLGIDFGDPLNVRTFSGSSYHIWSILKDKRILVDVFTPYPSKPVVNFFKVMSFRPNLQRWKAHWHRNVLFRKYLSAKASRRISAIDKSSINSTLQVGAYYDISKVWRGYKGLIADNNCVISQDTYAHSRTSKRAFRKQYEFEKRVYLSADNIFCFSTYLADSFVKDFGCSEEKVKVVYAGINLDEKMIFHGNKDYDSKTVLFSGFNFDNKGGKILLEAFEEVVKEIPEARLIMLGPKHRSFPDYVINHGPLSKSISEHMALIADSYRKASVFALPTLADAFPNVIREAMAARLPCIATDICGIPDMVEDGKTGFLIPPRDPHALSEKLIMLLKNPGLSRQLGEAGYIRYKEYFTWEKVCARILKQISWALKH